MRHVVCAMLSLSVVAGCGFAASSDYDVGGAVSVDGARTIRRTERDTPETPISRLPPASYAAAPRNAVTNGQITIQSDCLVQIKVKDDPSLDGNYAVNEIGAVELGYVGPVILFNMTARTAAHKIKDILDGRYFQNATVEVRILKASYDKIQVGGAVSRPGIVRIGAGDAISMNDALLRAGGIKASAKGVKVRVIRNGLLSALASTLQGEEYPLVSSEGKPSVPDVYLRNNDIVYVFSSGAEASVELGEKEVLVLGEVSKPGVYVFSGGESCTMLHLALKMGGFPPYANKKTVKVVRKDKDGFEVETKVNVEKVLETGAMEDDYPLENGDRVLVPARRISLF